MNTLNEVIAAQDRLDKGITFWGQSTSSISYADLRARVLGNVKHFLDCGVRFGDRVAIHIETDLEHVVTMLALMALGALPMSMKPPRGGPDLESELDPLYERFGARFTAGSLPARPHISAIRWDSNASSEDRHLVARVAATSPAFVQFTSGSLGDPKPIPIRHESLLHNARALLAIDGRHVQSAGGNVLPLSHDMGWIGFLSSLLVQSGANMCSIGYFLRRPLRFIEALGDCHAIALPDFLLRYLTRTLESNHDKIKPRLLSGLRTIYCGAEPIRESTIRDFVDVGVKFGLDPSALVFCYGMAEATLIVTARRYDGGDTSFVTTTAGPSVARVGTPMDGMEVRVGHQENGRFRETKPGELGTIWVRGPSVFHGYLDGPALLDGWHDTGDIGTFMGADLCVSGREKELIIAHGENLFPQDIEAFVSRVPGVRESVVLPDNDTFFLFLVADSNLDRVDVASRVAARFGIAPAGTAIGPTKEILRTTSGKPMRRAMLDQLRTREAFRDM
jgi:fatty-acyl-CoA synthase